MYVSCSIPHSKVSQAAAEDNTHSPAVDAIYCALSVGEILFAGIFQSRVAGDLHVLKLFCGHSYQRYPSINWRRERLGNIAENSR
jgi:hypothetical protein